MSIFNFGKKEAAKTENTNHTVKVLGGGCVKCHELEANAKAALAELNMKDSVELITDFSVIAEYGVMTTPALVVDNQVMSSGVILKKEEIMEILQKRSR